MKAVIIKDGSLLVLKRTPNRDTAELWDLPGGVMEKCDLDNACATLRREILEELGTPAVIGAFVCEFKHKHDFADEILTLIHYRAVINNPKEIKLSDEHTHFRWVLFSELKKLRFLSSYKNRMSTILGRDSGEEDE